ncbi:hypothetical protein [Aureibacter tunicatorum]|uniref:Flagellar biosynthesis/type III secretory pathway protein FliH n=1 Tax=Aureibacter tunicatorum TaxID=866807 RepID=A0AAE3XL25_9BACT|nr:hypothetical protein [Aureibacter tunicatorum]MDR6238402.1 flagellar biosynthesis/type III secretory pathway protein FliH [Aureibacter tunicatorum]BDD03434.1 hypothetical protein AUTU_09170 [Aureibacter tunicatorum]
MKKFSLIMIALLMGFATVMSFAQSSQKDAKKSIKKKAVKEARKEAKKLGKDGWEVAPGAIPLDKQLQEAWMRQYERDEKGYPMYYVSQGVSVSNSTAAAKLQAIELAKLELAGMISSDITALIENSVATNQLSSNDAESVTETVAASKNIIMQQLGRTLKLIEIFRPVGEGNTEVSVRIAYNQELAMEAAKKVLKKELEEKTEKLHGQIDDILELN